MAGYIGSKASVVSSGAERKKVITATAGQTSFTGLTYSPNRVHVFQNGVRLVDGTDYTATDGNSLTLTVGALADDQVVVVSYSGFQTSDTVSSSAGGTFTGDVNFTGSFTSQGIDDNATSTAMTLDGSGNLLVGTTSTTLTGNAGFTYQGGITTTSNNGLLSAIMNRNTSDGDIVQFRKDNATVGSIGVNSGTRIYIGSGDANLTFNPVGNYVFPSTSTGGARDAQLDLGLSAARFKDLYLSGGVFLGGTGSANKLDDYEEGTWTPTLVGATSGSCTVSANAVYTKVGRVVIVHGYINITGVGSASGNLVISNLPFSIADLVASTSLEASGTIGYYTGFATAVNSLTVTAQTSFSGFSIRGLTSSTAGGISDLNSTHIGTGDFRFSITYFTT
jgi:hypothetical protein